MKVNDKIRIFAVFCIVLLLSSSLVLAQDAPQPAAQPAATDGAAPAISDGTSKLPQCVGGDINKLAGGKGEGNNCLRYLDKFNKYAEEAGLTQYGYDPLFAFITAAGESGCRSIAAGDAGAPVGGILQTTSKCKALDNPENPCKTVDDEIRLGMVQITESVKKIVDQGYSGKDVAWLVWIAYNRGYGTTKRAIEKMKAGKSLADAIQEACLDEYDRPDRKNKFCYEWIPKTFNCNGNTFDAVCDGGRSCMGWSGCWVKPPYTTHYVEKDWVMYEKACATIGGQMVAAGAPIAAAPSGVGGAAGEEAAPAEEAGFKPTHPYFTVPYSINPSFSVKVPYDLSLYDEMPGYISKLSGCRDDVDCITGNVSLIEEEKEDLNWVVSYGGNIVSRDKAGILEYPHWQAYCEDPEQHAINSLAEAVDACARSKDKDCVCSYTLPIVRAGELSSWIGESFAAGEMEDFVSSLFGLISLSKNELSDQKWESRIMSFKKSGSDVKVSLFSTIDIAGNAIPIARESQVVENAEFKSVASDWRYEDNPRTLKYSVSSAGTVLDLYKDNNNNISVFEEGSAPSQKQCELHNKVVKFCVIQNKTFLAYNQRDNKMGMQQLVLKFSYLFKSDVTDVKGFEVKDARMATNTSLVIWEPVLGADVERYNLFHTDNLSMAANLKGVSPMDLTPELRADLEHLSPAILDLNQKQDADIAIADLLDPVCVVEGTVCQVKYKVTTKTGPQEPMPLDPSVLYYSRVDEKFFYLMPDVNNEQRYVFAITATQTDGAESPSFTQPGEGKQEDSVNDLSPALGSILYPVIEGGNLILPVAPVNSNIDGSYLDPASMTGFMLYCFDRESLTTFTGNVPLSSRQPLSVMGESLIDGGTRMVVPLSDLEAYCQFKSSPKVAYIALAATKGPTLFFNGEVSGSSFIQVTLP